MKKPSKSKTNESKKKPLSAEELSAIMDERVKEDLSKFIQNPPPLPTKKEEDSIRRRNEEGWV